MTLPGYSLADEISNALDALEVGCILVPLEVMNIITVWVNCTLTASYRNLIMKCNACRRFCWNHFIGLIEVLAINY